MITTQGERFEFVKYKYYFPSTNSDMTYIEKFETHNIYNAIFQNLLSSIFGFFSNFF